MPGLISQNPLEVGLFSLAEKRLAWADQRQAVLSENIANADTPGWKPLDVPPFAATLNSMDQRLMQTNAGDLAGAAGQAMQAHPDDRPEARSPDGNAVSLDAQLTKIADTQTSQQFVTNIYKTYLGMFNTALDK